MSNVDNIRLRYFGLPNIQSISDFSEQTHISKYTIYQLSKHSEKHYKTYQIPKKNGKLRTINQPSRKLKALQAWVLHYILSNIQVSSSCKGFRKKTSIVDNVEPHKFSNAVLNMDIKDFFPTVKKTQVFSVFKSIGYNSCISTILTNICIHENCLPQGSPCSPMLANLISWRLDIRIQGFVGKRGITYTRYADDLTFSGLNPVKLIKIHSTIQSIIEDEKFEVNRNKTRMAGPAKAKNITGLIISNGDFGIGQKKAKLLRSKIHHLTFPKEQTNIQLLNHVKGWLYYLNSVDQKRLALLKAYIKKLLVKYPSTLISKLA